MFMDGEKRKGKEKWMKRRWKDGRLVCVAVLERKGKERDGNGMGIGKREGKGCRVVFLKDKEGG